MTEMQDSTAPQTSGITPSRIVLVRHGQSVMNAGGIPPSDVANPLTETGRAQAQAFADSFSGTPTLFVYSPYLRTQQTAEPMLRRFPDVPAEEWPVQELTFLAPSLHNGTSEKQQLPYIEEYWKRADPNSIEGPGAESFSIFLGRVRSAIDRLSRIPATGCVVVFTHGQMMQAFRLLLLFPSATDKALMAHFRPFHLANFIRNTETIELKAIDGQLRLIGEQHLNLTPLQGELFHA